MELGYPGTLHAHTEYSNLRLRDSINRANDLIDYAIELGHEVIAITEHESVSNAIKVEKYYNKIKEKNPNFKVILGNEIYLCRDGLDGQNFEKGNDKYYHFILLAKNLKGHKQIRELSTRAWMRSYTAGKMRRTPTYYQDLIDIIGKDQGNVIGSTACLGGFLATKILQWVDQGRQEDFLNQIINWLKGIESIFGQGNFYLEMQPSASKEQQLVNEEILKLSEITKIPYIITTDAHYQKKEDAGIHKAFLNSQDGDREVDSFYATTYMMGTEELESFFLGYMDKKYLEISYKNILTIKNACEDYSLRRPLKIPSLKWRIPVSTLEQVEKYYPQIPHLKYFVESKVDSNVTMARLIVDKLESDVRLRTPEIYKELESNLEITKRSSIKNNANWSAYFINLQHILDVCWSAGTLVGPGRGSGVGFLLLFILDIIQINPVWETTKTYSWRLTNRFKGLLCLATSLK